MPDEFGGIEIEPSPSPADTIDDFGGIEIAVDPSSNFIVPRATISPREQFIANYIASEQRPALSQVASAAAVPFQIGGEMLRTLGGGAEALGEVMGRSTLPSTVEQPLSQRIAESLSTSLSRSALPLLPSAITDTIGRAIPQVVQAGQEGGARILFDLGNIINQAVRFARDEPMAAARALTPIGIAESILPRTPSLEEAERAFERSQTAQQAASVAAQPLVPEILGPTSIPLAEGMRTVAELAPGAPLALSTSARVAEALARGTGRVAGAIPGTMRTMAGRGFTIPTIEKATGLLGVTEEQGLLEILGTAPPRILEAQGKAAIPKTAKSAIQAATRTEEVLLDKALTNLKKVQGEGLTMNGDRMIEMGRAQIIKDFPLNVRSAEGLQEVDQVLSKFKNLQGDIPPVEGQTFLRQLNNDYDRLIDKNSPEASAYRAIRGNLSDQLDDLNKIASGLDEAPYRDWGKVRQFKVGVQNKIIQAQTSAGAEAVPTQAQGPGSIPVSGTRGALVGAALRRGARMTRPLIKQPIEFVDEATEAVFKDSPKRVDKPKLGQDRINSLREQYTKRPPMITETPINVPPVRVPASRSAASEFSPETQEALRAMGATPRDPYYQALGRSIQRRGQVIPPQ